MVVSMSTISIRKSKDPMYKVFSFIPGEKIHIHVKFGDQIPDHYRLQVLDQRNNSRLNRYGKGSKEGIVLDWPIPRTIRDEHFGSWQIQVDADTGNFGHIFYVEHRERIEPPMLIAVPIALEVVGEQVVAAIVEEEMIQITQEGVIPDISSVKPSVEATPEEPAFVSKTPVTAIGGLGKTYADRLVKIQVYSISEFWYYPDRVSIAEIMRVNDAKLSRMLQDAEILLSQEAERISLPVDEQIEIIPDDLLSVDGIGPKSVEKLVKLGIHSKSDLLDYKDLESLRKTLRMSLGRLKEVLASLGKIVAPTDVIEPQTIDPLVQPVISVRGIGAKTAQKLAQGGIMTVQDLMHSSFTTVQNLVTETAYNKWKQNAAIFAGQQPTEVIPSTKTPTEVELTSISGVGSKTVQRLNEAGVLTLNDLVEYELEELVGRTRFSKQRLTKWQAQAKELLS